MAKVFVTRRIPDSGLNLLKEAGHDVVISEKDGVLTKEELVAMLKAGGYDAVLCLLTDKIDGEVFGATSAKIFANYAVGFDNIDLPAAKERGITITNTPGVLTDSVAEHTFALIMAVSHRIAEGDRFVRAGKYTGWGPLLLLGTDLKGKTLGILGAGRIGAEVVRMAVKGFGMKALYHDTKQIPELETEYGAVFCKTSEELLQQADVVSIHVPLLESTKHLINKERLALMKKDAYLINTSRGPVIDEGALVDALKNKIIRGAGLDVFEHEPQLSPGMAELENIVLTPHTASATDETRSKMAQLAGENIIAFLKGEAPNNAVL